MKEIIIASTNLHKIQEYKYILEPLGYKIYSLIDIDPNIDIIEDGNTFEENALIKANYLSKLLNKTVISDDSGLEVESLNNEPGIYSARYMGKDTSYDIKNNNIIERVNEFNNRKCRYVCSIAISNNKQESKVFTGYMNGTIAYIPKGTNGFGFDPIFYIEELDKTVAELTDLEKNNISHRANASKLLLDYLND